MPYQLKTDSLSYMAIPPTKPKNTESYREQCRQPKKNAYTEFIIFFQICPNFWFRSNIKEYKSIHLLFCLKILCCISHVRIKLKGYNAIHTDFDLQ